ncbi:amidohydrolase family protein [uncultured Micrococcus sp.]|uniref:amidohydrolase family protein n=1 Tax=uncultured Micrococcus sp. TaxID=114051 RepID=UPI0025FD60B5|nr:amidohydrolase family protein [uncultured Micrococcus sp.]
MGMLIRNATVLTMTEAGGAAPQRLCIRVEGTDITEVGPTVTERAEDEVVDGAGLLVTPGMVNAHTHSWETFAKGRYDNLPLEMWMLLTYPMIGLEPLPPELISLRSRMFALLSLKAGVTTIVDDVLETPDQDLTQLAAVMDAYDAAGIRANVSGHLVNIPMVDTMPYVADLLPSDVVQGLRAVPMRSADEYVAFTRESIRLHQGRGEGRLRAMVAPSAPQRCTPDALSAGAELAVAEGLEYHIHVLETKTQNVTGELFYGMTLPAYLDSLGALTPNTTLAHAIWTSPEDIELLATRGTSISHNTLSNLKLGSGIAPWRAYHRAGVTVGLGTDGHSSSDTARLLEVVKAAALLHKVTDPEISDWPTVEEVLTAATRGGARTAMLQDEVGQIAPGYRADLLFWDMTTLNFTPLQNPARHLVYAEEGTSLRRVIVNGRTVVQDGVCTSINEDAVIAEVHELAPMIRARQHETDRLAQILMPSFGRMHDRCAHAPSPVHRWSGAVPDPRP